MSYKDTLRQRIREIQFEIESKKERKDILEQELQDLMRKEFEEEMREENQTLLKG